MSAKIFLGNLPWSVRYADLEEVLAERGLTFSRVEVLLERDPGSDRLRSRGFGFVHFDTEEEAGRARDLLSDLVLRGRPIRVDRATAQQSEVGPGGRRLERRGGAPRPRERDRGGDRRRSPGGEDLGQWSRDFFPDPDFSEEG